MLMRARWVLALSTLLSGGCDCDHEHGNPILFSGGITRNGVYQSSEVSGPWLEFPGGRRFVLEHGLGTTPIRVNAYLSFREYPLEEIPDGSPNFTPAAGDPTLIEGMDAQKITIRNGTCADFYVRVVADADPGPADAGAD